MYLGITQLKNMNLDILSNQMKKNLRAMFNVGQEDQVKITMNFYIPEEKEKKQVKSNQISLQNLDFME